MKSVLEHWMHWIHSLILIFSECWTDEQYSLLRKMKLAICVVSFVTLSSFDIVSAHLFYWRMKDRTENLMQASSLFPQIFKDIVMGCLNQGYQHSEHVPSRPREVLGFDIQYCGETSMKEKDSCHKSFMFVYDSNILNLLETVGDLLQKYERGKEITDNVATIKLDALLTEIKQKLKSSVIKCSNTDNRNYIQLSSTDDLIVLF